MVALSPAEILEITGKTQPAAQLRHLRRMGIRAERRADGTVCVLHAWLTEKPGPDPKTVVMAKSVRLRLEREAQERKRRS